MEPPSSPHPETTVGSRRRDLLLTLVMVCIGITPAWFLPAWLATPWLTIGLLGGLGAAVVSWRYSPWLPTPAEDLGRILTHLALEPHHHFCDLGAGDGRTIVRAQRATGATCTGIELSPIHYLVARVRVAIQGSSRTSVHFGNLYRHDLSPFDAVYVWGTAYLVSTPQFGAYMRQVLRPGCRLVSYHHPVCGLEPVEVDAGGIRPVYVYVVDTPPR